jgi:hypothetical protein
MGDAARPESRRPRIAVLVALAAALAAGVGLGVLLDRLWLRPTRAAAEDPRLVGRWVEEEAKTPLEFRTDGTFEYVRVTTTEVPVLGPRPDDIKKEKVRREERVTGRYRWVDGGTIELLEPDFGGAWMAMRFVIEGDRLTLLRTDGSVRRFTRSR